MNITAVANETVHLLYVIAICLFYSNLHDLRFLISLSRNICVSCVSDFCLVHDFEVSVNYDVERS